MNIGKEQLRTFGGLLLHGSAFCLTATTGGTSTIAAGLVNAIAGELVASHVGTLGNFTYDKLVARLKGPDPNTINHDLERLFRQSAVVALQYIKTLFLAEIKESERVQALHKKEKKEFIEGLTQFFDENIKDLRLIIKDAQNLPLDKSDISNPGQILDDITAQLFRVSSVEFDEQTAAALRSFYADKLPYCFQLAFKEALKNDDSGFKAFQIWVLEDIQTQNAAIAGGQQRIEQAISELKTGIDYLSRQKADSISEAAAADICALLEKDFSGIKDSITVLSHEIREKFAQQYSLLATVDETTRETLAVTAQTAIAVKEIKDKIDGVYKPPHHLIHPLPAIPEIFLGRDKELEDIRQKLFGENNFLLLVNGQGGIGKTSLAATYYHTQSHHYHHAAWVLSEKSIINALLLLAAPLHVHFEDAMPATERAEKLIAAMAELDKPCLLVIDNANELHDLEQSYLLLRQCSNFHLLLTTRITGFQQAEKYTVKGLPDDVALEIFNRHYPKHDNKEDDLFRQIWIAVDKNTLVAELLAKNLNEKNQHELVYTLTNLLKNLQEKGLLALESQQVQTGYQAKGSLRREKPEAIIEAMYELGDLGGEEIDLLSVFAVLPAENIPYPVLKSILNPEEVPSFAASVSMLYRKGWLDKNEIKTDAHYKISPVIQEIVRKKNDRLLTSCGPLINGLIDKLDYEPGTGHLINVSYQEAAVFARYAETIAFNLRQADEGLAILCEQLGSYHSTTGNLDKALNYYEDETKLFEELYEAYPQNVSFKKGLAISYSKLGDTQSALGNLDKALNYYEKYAALSKEIYEAYPQNVSFKNGLAISYEKLGEAQAALGNLDKALNYYEDETKLFEELYETDPQNVSFKNGLAISYSKLGDTKAALGNLDKALNYYEQYTTLRKEIYEAYPQNVSFKNGLAISFQKLGSTQAALGNLDKALNYYEDETKLFKELYEAYPQNVSFKNGLAVSFEKLGSTQAALGNLDKALNYYEERSRLGKELYEAYPQNVSFKNGLAVSYSQLGRFYQNKNEKEKAIEFFKKCEILWQELATVFPAYAEFQRNLNWVKNRLEQL